MANLARDGIRALLLTKPAAHSPPQLIPSLPTGEFPGSGILFLPNVFEFKQLWRFLLPVAQSDSRHFMFMPSCRNFPCLTMTYVGAPAGGFRARTLLIVRCLFLIAGNLTWKTVSCRFPP
jgi:hypothetical protein